MSWQEGTGLRVVGTVVRVFVSPAGKFGKLTLKVNEPPHPPQLDFKTMDREVIGEMRELRAGQRIQVMGKIQSEKVQDKKYDDVKVDGYPVWVPVLRPTKFDVEGSSKRPSEKPKEPAPGATDDPFKRERQPGDDDGDPMGGGSDPFGG